MANKMPASDIEESSALPRKRARRSSPLGVSHSPSPQPAIAPSKGRHRQFNYIRGLSNRERVDLVLARLDDEHRWTIKDLIYYMVTEESEKKYGKSTKKRARDISTAIFDDKAVINALSRASNHLRDHQILDMAKVFQTELRALCAEPGLGEFKAEIEPHNLNISGLASRAKELAPGLWHFMQDVIRSSSADDDKGEKGIDSDLFMICMMLAHLKAPWKNGSFHTILGIHLHSMGVKRRVIDLLASLGVTVTYPTILTHSNTTDDAS
jgi:hypothetical protein